MAIISSKKVDKKIRYKSTHFRYALTYIVITFAVLLFLNIYTARTNQAFFYSNKEAWMTERCNLASKEISQLQIVNRTTILDALSRIGSLRVTRVIVTDNESIILYDSNGTATNGETVIEPEIKKAISGNLDVFSWSYENGAMTSCICTPIISYGSPIGAVYMMEYDTQQGEILYSIQINTLTISIALEAILILFSLFFSKTYTRRLRRIMVSMRIIRNGDYTHKVNMGGNDELTVLGEEFNDLVEKLYTSEKRRRQFVSDASHELKTPLASIKLLSDSILQNEMDLQTSKEFVEDIGSEADRLTRMSEKLLTLTYTEAHQEPEFEICKIGPTVERVVRMLSLQAQKNNILIELDLNEDCPILIMEDDLHQIIFNLVENGLKYNVINGKLQVRLVRQEDTVILKVSDTGVGIPKDALENIFERFYRVDKARSRQTGGSGLGLSIVHSIVERNNGTINVTSQLGVGSEFSVCFPIFETDDTL